MNRKINYYVTLDNKTMHWIRLGIFVVILTQIAVASAVLSVAYTNNKNTIRETDARIKYQESLIKQLGQPQIIEQRYFSPQEGKK